MSWIDISRPVSPETAVWPGDRAVTWTWTARREEGSTVNLGALHMSVHAGTHADAPLHVSGTGKPINKVDLDPYVGCAEVLHVNGQQVTPADVESVSSARVLFRTTASDVPTAEWPDRITAITPEAVEILGSNGVVLVGTDAPSVDPLDSKTLDAHHALNDAGIVNLEGLLLRDVAPGFYELIALPLRIEGADGAPVRAVLRRI